MHKSQHSKKVVQNDTPVQLASNKNSGIALTDNRRSAVIQMGGGKVHHDPEKKKYLPKGVGAEQNAVSAAALEIKKASDGPMSNKEAKRQAKDKLKD